MKRVVITLILTFAVSPSVLAGDIPTDGSSSPAPHVATETPKVNPSVPGDISTSGSLDELSSDALSALLSVLGFLAV